MTSYEAYQLFLAIKQHFTSSSYDYHKYNGKVRTTVDSFEKRRDGYHFRKLAALPDPKARIVACMLHDITWIKDVISAKGEKAESDYQKIVQGFSYAFKSFLDRIQTPLNLATQIRSEETRTYPPLAQQLLDDQIDLPIIIALDDLVPFLPTWDKKFEPILWDRYKERITKYRPFFDYDKGKIKQIFIDWTKANR